MMSYFPWTPQERGQGSQDIFQGLLDIPPGPGLPAEEFSILLESISQAYDSLLPGNRFCEEEQTQMELSSSRSAFHTWSQTPENCGEQLSNQIPPTINLGSLGTSPSDQGVPYYNPSSIGTVPSPLFSSFGPSCSSGQPASNGVTDVEFRGLLDTPPGPGLPAEEFSILFESISQVYDSQLPLGTRICKDEQTQVELSSSRPAFQTWSQSPENYWEQFSDQILPTSNPGSLGTVPEQVVPYHNQSSLGTVPSSSFTSFGPSCSSGQPVSNGVSDVKLKQLPITKYFNLKKKLLDRKMRVEHMEKSLQFYQPSVQNPNLQTEIAERTKNHVQIFSSESATVSSLSSNESSHIDVRTKVTRGLLELKKTKGTCNCFCFCSDNESSDSDETLYDDEIVKDGD